MRCVAAGPDSGCFTVCMRWHTRALAPVPESAPRSRIWFSSLPSQNAPETATMATETVFRPFPKPRTRRCATPAAPSPARCCWRWGWWWPCTCCPPWLPWVWGHPTRGDLTGGWGTMARWRSRCGGGGVLFGGVLVAWVFRGGAHVAFGNWVRYLGECLVLMQVAMQTWWAGGKGRVGALGSVMFCCCLVLFCHLCAWLLLLLSSFRAVACVGWGFLGVIHFRNMLNLPAYCI